MTEIECALCCQPKPVSPIGIVCDCALREEQESRRQREAAQRRARRKRKAVRP